MLHEDLIQGLSVYVGCDILPPPLETTERQKRTVKGLAWDDIRGLDLQ